MSRRRKETRQIELPYGGWTPRPLQRKAWSALRDPKIKTHVLAWHRRAGKDDVAMHDAAIRIAERPGNHWHLLPVQEQARKAIWEAVNPRTGQVRWKDAFPPEMIKHVDNQAMKLTFHNQSTWQVLGSDNYNSLVGTTPVHIVFSEAALADPAAYGFFRPILLENEGTSLHISSTRGHNHFKRLYDTLQDDPTAHCQRLSAMETGVFTREQLITELAFYKDLYGDAIGESLFRQEYLSDWDASSIGAIFTAELTAIRDSGRADNYAYDPNYPVDTSWDIGVADETVILFWQMRGSTPVLIDWYAATDIGIEHYAEVLASKPYHYRTHYAPHDIKVREWIGGLGRIQEARRFGINFVPVVKLGKGDQIALGSSLLKRALFHISPIIGKQNEDDTEFILTTLQDYKFKFNKETRVMSKAPDHNYASHYADAMLVYAVGVAQTALPYTAKTQGLQGRSAQPMPRLNQLMAAKQAPRRGAW